MEFEMGYLRADGVVYEVVDGKAMLVDLAGKELLTLNTVGTLIWNTLPEYGDPATMALHLVTHFKDVTVDELEGDIRGFLRELAELGLLVSDD